MNENIPVPCWVPSPRGAGQIRHRLHIALWRPTPTTQQLNTILNFMGVPLSSRHVMRHLFDSSKFKMTPFWPKIYTIVNERHSLVNFRHDSNHFFDINELNMTSSLSQPITSLGWDHVTVFLSQFYQNQTIIKLHNPISIPLCPSSCWKYCQTLMVCRGLHSKLSFDSFLQKRSRGRPSISPVATRPHACQGFHIVLMKLVIHAGI